jgi:hypothetical protein
MLLRVRNLSWCFNVNICGFEWPCAYKNQIATNNTNGHEKKTVFVQIGVIRGCKEILKGECIMRNKTLPIWAAVLLLFAMSCSLVSGPLQATPTAQNPPVPATPGSAATGGPSTPVQPAATGGPSTPVQRLRRLCRPYRLMFTRRPSPATPSHRLPSPPSSRAAMHSRWT